MNDRRVIPRISVDIANAVKGTLRQLLRHRLSMTGVCTNVALNVLTKSIKKYNRKKTTGALVC